VEILFDADLRQAQMDSRKKIVTDSGTNTSKKPLTLLFKSKNNIFPEINLIFI
jgi:hypothetical protein